MSPAPDRGRTAWRVMVAAWIVLGLLAARLTQELFLRSQEYDAIRSEAGAFLPALRILAVGACAAAMALALARRTRLRDAVLDGGSAGFGLRVLLYMFIPAFAAGSVAYAWGFAGEMFAVRSVFFSTYLLGAGLWLGRLAAGPDALRRAPGAFARVAEVLVVNLILVLVVGEGLVHLYGRLFPSALLWNEGSVVSRIEANRLPPGAPIWGFRANQGGFHDREFFRAEGDDFVVALLADSFGLGVVPHAYNFATVAEELLEEELAGDGRRVAVHNFGVGAIGMAEYAWLWENEVDAWNPTVVVLCVFVGNDIHGFQAVDKRYYCVQNLQLYEWITRLFRLGEEGFEAGRLPGGNAVDPGLAEETPAFVHDPAKEVPSFSEETFLEVELERSDIVDTSNRLAARRWEGFFDAMEAFREKVGSRLRVAILPDEFQVNDALWASLMERVDAPEGFRRDLPQERILAYCREHGVPALDLLPALRTGGQERRVYHLRDTHWNAAGNAIAGRELAAFVLANP